MGMLLPASRASGRRIKPLQPAHWWAARMLILTIYLRIYLSLTFHRGASERPRYACPPSLADNTTIAEQIRWRIMKNRCNNIFSPFFAYQKTIGTDNHRFLVGLFTTSRKKISAGPTDPLFARAFPPSSNTPGQATGFGRRIKNFGRICPSRGTESSFAQVIAIAMWSLLVMGASYPGF